MTEKQWKEPVAIYGAAMVGVSVYYAIKTLYENCRVTCFIVSAKEGNPAEIDKIPVVSLEEFEQRDATVLIATPENHHSTIMAELKKRGFSNYICMDSQREAALMEQYYETIQGFPTLKSCIREPGGEPWEGSLKVCMTKFHKDTPLKNPYEQPGWVYPVQAGAALTDRRITDLLDNQGDHISEKNGNYSELTVMYWMWKNSGKICSQKKNAGQNGAGSREETANEYLGLFHYRRILDLSEEDFYRAGKQNVDVILPYPTIHFPSIEEHHRRYVKEEDWNAMIAALTELEPQYARSMPGIFSQPYFYNYNMFIARKNIFEDFCSWLFPILERTEELSTPKGRERSDRYIGYLGENLTTLYFLYHRHDYRIAHTGRRMLL